MASIFTTIPGNSVKGSFGKNVDVPVYLQFVPGVVVNVIHSGDNKLHSGESSINQIIALPHITDKTFVRKETLGDEYRYYPLLRTMHDIPSKGDPVLLCTIGNTRYYLGPLNTSNNNPTWNDDPLYRIKNVVGKNKKITDTELKYQSPNFNKENLYKRLVKIRKPDLDYGTAINETTGDTLIEGRHGNSIRIGSRSDNPYVFISNGRNVDANVEGIVDGSLISITSDGTLQQHFGGYTRKSDNELEFISQFTLSSDLVNENKRLMGSIISSINNIQDSSALMYNYSDNQILLNSERITLNTRKDDLYLSSNKDIHIGTGRHLTISTNKNLIIESQNTYLGDPNKLDNKEGDTSLMEPMVLGNKLLEILGELIGTLKEANGLVQGVAVPLVDPTMAPLVNKITPIEHKLETILSQHHYVEPNKGTEK